MKLGLKAAAAMGLTLAGALAATPLATAQPRPAPAQSRQCFYARNINNYTTAGGRLVYIRVGVADVYRLDLMTDCPELGFRQDLQFTRADPGASICSAIDLTIRFREPGARRICPVAEMRKLTPEEVAAMPKRDRP
jgi:hypothetical protein